MLDKEPYLVYKGKNLYRDFEVKNLKNFQCSIIYLDQLEAKSFSDFLSKKRKDLAFSRITNYHEEEVSEIIERVLEKVSEQTAKKTARAKTKKDPEKEKARKEELAKRRQARKDKKILEDIKKRGLVEIEEQNEQV